MINLLKYLAIFLVITFIFSNCKTMNGLPEVEIYEPEDLSDKEIYNMDSISIILASRYKAGLIKYIFQGKNYRKAWSTPLKVKVAMLDDLKGGLLPIKLGGGMQTLSMDLQGKDGIVYTLRSVNKNSEEIIPKFIDKIKLGNLVMDATSAQHPYAALLAASLANAVGVLNTHPEVVYLPSQPRLDTFNQQMAGQVFLLEYEPEGSGAWLNIKGVKGIIDSEAVLEKLSEHPNSKIDERALVRARLFDLLIGDNDRHIDQWGWIVVETEDETTYVPLPTDRDNAFFNPQGILFWIMNRPFAQESLRPFRKKIKHLPGLMKPFDQQFLFHTADSIFIQVALELKNDLTNAEIDKALLQWPSPFTKLDGKKIRKRLISRRDNLPKYAKEFKIIINKRGAYENIK